MRAVFLYTPRETASFWNLRREIRGMALFGDVFRKAVLSESQRSFWDTNGYLVIESLIPQPVVDALNMEIDALQRRQKTYPQVVVDVSHGSMAGRRLKMEDVPDDAFQGPFKISDLFLWSSAVRACNLDARLRRILDELLDGEPILFNSLNFIYGSTQAAHYDSWFMPPRVKDKMLATSICLDVHHADNGPVFYYPGSHKVPPYVFPHGGIAKLDADLAPAVQYAAETTRDLKKEIFCGKPGDVLIWHGQLLHGGSAINDMQDTRRSLVSHYLRAKDVPATARVKNAEGLSLKREPIKLDR